MPPRPRLLSGFVGLLVLACSAFAYGTAFTVSPASLSFGNQVVQTASAPHTLILTNTSAGTFTFSLSPSAGYTASDNCSETVAVGAACQIAVIFTPPALGTQTGSLVISKVGGSFSVTVSLTGNGVPATTISPGTLTFGNVGEATSSAGQTVTLTNHQDIPLNIVATSSPSPDYVITTPATGGCSGSIPKRSACTFTVAFVPHSLQAENGVIVVTDDANTSPSSIAVSGTGVPAMSLNKSAKTFGTQVVGTTSAAGNFVFTNNTTTKLKQITLAINPAADFSASGCAPPIAALASCTIQVLFTPQGPGTRTATLNVSSAQLPNGAVTASLSGPAVPPVTISPASPAIDFPSTGVGLQSAPVVITFINNQTTALTFGPHTLAGDFVLQSKTCGGNGATLGAGASCTYTILFAPTQAGNRFGTLTVNDNTVTGQHQVQFYGSGTNPISASKSALPFATQYVTSTSPQKKIVVTNHENIPDQIVESVSGPFTALDDCAGTIPALSTCNVWVTFAPTAATSYSNELTITESAVGQVLAVSLTGTGTGTPPTPAVVTVAPGAGQLGTSVPVTISGANTHFSISSALSFGNNISFQNQQCPTPTLCTATAVISSSAVPGARTVTVTTGTEVATLSSGFAVSSSAGLTFQTISPNSEPQGVQNVSIALHAHGAHFTAGMTYGNFGDGITINSITVTDSTDATVNISISPYANPGWRAVTLVTGGEFVVSGVQGFDVTSDGAQINSISPNTGAQGQNVLGVTLKATGSNFLAGATMVSFGGAVNVGAITVVSPMLLRFDVAVPPSTAPGSYPITITTGGETATLPSAFTVTLATPSINTVVPNSLAQCQSGDVTITGILTDFVNNPPTVTFGSDITQTSPLTVNSATSITAHLSVSCTAAIGARTGDLTSGSSDFNFGFSVTPSNAKIVGVTPSSGPQGGSVSITVVGLNTHWIQGTTIGTFYSPVICPFPPIAPAITVNRVTVQNTTTAVLDLSIPSNAIIGPNTFCLVTGGEIVTSSFSVYAATPSLTVSPNSGMPGQTVPVTFTGQFTHFNCDATKGQVTEPTIDGNGVSFAPNPNNSNSPLTCSSPELATATLIISPTASAAGHTITLTTGDEIVTTGFSVVTTPASLLSITPYHSPTGITGLPVQIVGQYTHFQQGVTTLSLGPGITVESGSLTVADASHLSAVIDVSSTAAYGWRSAYVNTGSEQLTIAFLVDAPGSPAISSVSPSSGEQGESGFNVEVTGANTHWVQGNTEFIMGAGITVVNTSVTDNTHATLTLAISFTAPVGPNGGTAITKDSNGNITEVATGQGFTVTTGAASEVLSATITPQKVTVSQTLNVTLIGTGTHWLQGETSAQFDSGIAVDSLNVSDPTHATMQITVLSSVLPGFHTLTLFTGGEIVSLPLAVDVVTGSPTLLSTTPNGGQQGATFTVQVLGQFTHFDSTSTANFGNGITVNSFTAQDSATGVANITVDPLSNVEFLPGCNSVTVTTGTEQESLTNQFCIETGPATVLGVSPGFSSQGNTLTISVVGQNTHFRNGLTTATFSPGITAGTVNVIDTTHATMNIAVATNAQTGFYGLTMATQGEMAGAAQAFQVNPGSGSATLSGVAPFQGQQGVTLAHTKVFGQFTHWSKTTPTVVFGQGISVSNLSVQDDQTLYVDLLIDPLAQVGGRNVTVTTQLSGGAEIVSGNLFTVLAGPAVISTVAPMSGNQGQQVTLQISGQQTHWLQGLTQFYMSGLTSDITLNNLVINSATSATALLTISPTANLGARSIYMTTAGEALADSSAFVITGGIPAIASIQPTYAQPGTNNLNVQILGLYTTWLTGAPRADFGPGILVQGLTTNSDTSLTAVLNIDPAATLGYRTVVIRNGNQVLLGSFQVAPPPSPYIAYYTPTSALTGQTLTISFTGASTKWDPSPTSGTTFDMGSDITINSFQVTSQTTALANVTIPLTAAIGQRSMTLTTGSSETEQVLFTIVDSTSGAVQVISIVDPGSGMQGQSMSVNVIGQYTVFDSTTVFNFGPGITVGTPTIVGPTIANVPISIDQLATLGGRNVTATTGGVIAGGASFTVTASTAAITAVTPNTAPQGTTGLSLRVIGSNTHWNSGTTFSFGSGITVTNVSVSDNTEATITFSIDPLATIGAYAVTAQTAGEVASLNNAFVVTAGTPVILSSAPATGQQQGSVTFTILGQVTNWNGLSAVNYGDGVTVNSVTVTSPASITAVGQISATAQPGPRTLTVTTGTQVLTYSNVFSVTAGPASISAVAPGQSNQGTTLTVEVTGANTNFDQNYTTASFGSVITPFGNPAIVVDGIQINSPTDATLKITVDPFAPPQYYPLTLSTVGETASSSSAFQVIQSTPVLTFVNQPNVAQGATTSVTVSGLFTGFNSSTVFNFGSGVTVNGTSSINSTVSATVSITVSPTTTIGPRTVTATTGTQIASGASLLNVVAGPAYIASVTPSTGQQNTSGLPITIIGNNTHFTAGTPQVSLGPGVSVIGLLVSNDTALIATVNIDPSAPLQSNTVTVQTGGETASLAGGFTVAQGAPVLTAVTGSPVPQGSSNVNVTFTGMYTHFAQGQTTASVDSSITVNSVTVSSAASVTVNLTVSASAALGSHTITFTTGSEVVSTSAFLSVTSPAATISAVSQNAAQQGQTFTLTITGSNTHFAQGSSSVAFYNNTYGYGSISTSNVAVSSATSLTVQVNVSDGTPISQYTVSVTTNSETATDAIPFNILAGTAGISTVSPNYGTPGQNGLNVAISGNFLQFQQGVTTVSFSGVAGAITVTGVTVNDSNDLTATLNISGSAALGPYNVTVTTNSVTATAASAFSVLSCTGSGPTLLYAGPNANVTNVPINAAVSLEFNKPLNRASVNTTNFSLQDYDEGSAAVAGSVNVDVTGRIVTFVPANPLAVGHQFYVNANGLQDGCGYTSSGASYYFTTSFASQQTGPSFLASNVSSNDTNVPTNAVVELQFSDPINPGTAVSAISVTQAGIPVVGNFSLNPDDSIAIFTPTNNFAANTTYTVFYSAQITDDAGNALTNPGSFSFTTGAGTATGNPNVVGTSPYSGQTGVGTNTRISVQFTSEIDALYLDSSNFYLADNYTGYIVPTTISLSPDRTVATLTPDVPLKSQTFYYLYVRWSGPAQISFNAANFYFTTGAGSDSTAETVSQISPSNGAQNVPVNTQIVAVMSKPVDYQTVGNNAIQLMQGSTPVAGTSSLAGDYVTLTFTPSVNLAPATNYNVVVSGFSDSDGNPVATYNSAFTTSSSSTAATGSVSWVSYGPTGTGISTTSPVTLVFSRQIDPATVNTSSFEVYYYQSGCSCYQHIPGTYSVVPDSGNPSESDVTFTPLSPYPANTQVTVTGYTSMQDFAGNSIQNGSFTFTTTNGTDSSPFVVSSISPANNTGNVGRSAEVVVTFNKSVNASTISAGTGKRTVQMYSGDAPLNPSVSFSSDFRSIILNAGALPASSTITVVLTHNITDLYGNALADYTAKFTTENDNNTASGPHAVEIRPANGASDVPVSSPITLYLSNPIDSSTISSGFYVSQNGVLISGTAVAAAGGYAIQFTPNGPFALGAQIQAFLTNAARTTDETSFAANSWVFNTLPDPSSQAPSVIAFNPERYQNNAPLNSVIQVGFDEPLSPATVNSSNVQLTSNCASGSLTGTPSLDPTGRIVTIPPNAPLSANCYYYLNITNGLQNTQGIGQNENLSELFYTGTSSQTTAPTITAVAPPNGAANVGTNAHISITFSGPINVLTANNSTVQLNSGSIPVSIFFDPTDSIMTLYPLAPLPASATVTLTLNGLQDVAANPVAAKTVSFATAATADTSNGYIVSSNIPPGSTVSINAIITLLASKLVDVRTVNNGTITLYDASDGTYLPMNVSLGPDQQTVTALPTTALPVGHQLDLYASNLRDLDGFSMSSYSELFYTSYSPSTATPQVLVANPSNGATQVPVNTILQAQLNEPVRPDLLSGITLAQGTAPVSITVGLDATQQILSVYPAVPLNPSVNYKLTISGLQDLAGNSQTGSSVINFSTATGADLNGPVIVDYSPASGECCVGTNATIQVQFDKPLNPVSLTSNSLRLVRDNDSVIIPATLSLSADETIAYLKPNSPMQGNTNYHVYVSYYASLTDEAGNISNNTSFTFTTAAGSVSSETISSISPPNGATGVPVNSQVNVVASQYVDPITVTNASITLVACSGTGSAASVPGTVSLSGDQVTLTYTPNGSLPAASSCGGVFTVTVSGFSDVNGNAVTRFTSTFTLGSSGNPVTSGPTVGVVNPPNQATGISVTSTISASFSGSEIDPLTVNNGSFRVVDDTTGTVLSGTYSVTPIGTPPTGSLVTFTPAQNYAPNSRVDVYVNIYGYMSDYAGNTARGNSSSYFTTASTADSKALQVVSVSPANGTQNVGQNDLITLTFNKSVNPKTVGTSYGNNVALYSGSSPISSGATMSADNSSVTLSPGVLPLGATITVVASSAITDISGNPLTPFSSTFTVTSESAAARPTIVSQRPVNGASLVPTTATITLFCSGVLNPSTVDGAVHVSQNGVIVPGTVNLTGNGQAIAFTPSAALSAGSIIQIFVDQTLTDMNGNSLASTYSSQFTTVSDPTVTIPSVIAVSPTYGAQNIPTNASVFTIAYNEALNPSTVSTSTVSLYSSTAGYLTGYTVSLDSTRTILTVIAPPGGLTAGAYYEVIVSNGIQNTAGLAESQSTPVYFSVGTSVDNSIPAVTGLIPTTSATGVGVNARAVVTFNKALNYILGTFQLLQGTTVVPAEVTVSNTALTEFVISPYAPLMPNTTYTISISGAEDNEGNVAPTKTASFTTGSGPDLNPPVPVATNFGTNCGYCGTVPTNTVLYWLFNKPLASSTVNSGTVYLLDNNSNLIPATTSLSADGMTVILQPTTALTANYNYYHAHVTGVSDLDGNVLNPSLSGALDLQANCTNYCSFYFGTGASSDTSAPTVQMTSPENGWANAPLNAIIEAQVSKPINAGSFDGVTLKAGSTVVPASVWYGANQQIVEIYPNALLAANTTYTVTLSGLTDMTGNPLPKYSWSFTTGTSATLTTPVPTFNPTNGAISVDASAVTITYNKPINPISANTTNSVVLYGGGQVLPATYTYSTDLTTITITPTSALTANTLYYIYAYYVQDLAGNVSGTYRSSFTTGNCLSAPSGLVSWWTGDGTVNDLLGINNPSAFHAISFVPGEVGTGFTFGSGAYIDIPASSSLANQQFTWTAWVMPNGPGPNNDQFGSVIIEQAIDDSDASISLWWSALDEHIRFGFGNISTETITSADTFPAGSFYFVTVSYDGSTFRLYVNGTMEASFSEKKTIDYTSNTWNIGSTNAGFRAIGYPRTWNGVIDEVQAFNNALSQAEIQSMYMIGSAGECK